MVISIETTIAHPRRGFIKLEDTVAVNDRRLEAFGDRGRAGMKSRRRTRLVALGAKRSVASLLASCAGRGAAPPRSARPRPRARSSVACAVARPSATATSAVPSDWPISRPEDLQAGSPAASLAWRAADDHPIVGRLEQPNPRRDIAKRQASETGVELPRPRATRTSPPLITKRLMLPRRPGRNFFDGQASGDWRDQGGGASGQGASSSPEVDAEWPSRFSK